MQLIESSLYASHRTLRELQALASVGVGTIVEPTTYLGTPRRSLDTYMDDYERMIVAETARCASAGIEHLTLVGVPALDVAHVHAAHQAIDHLPKALARHGVVGIGEVGYETFSEEETGVLRRQMQVARATGMPIVIQAPARRKAHAVGLSLQLAEAEGLDRTRVLVKGLDEESLAIVKRFGAWAGLTVHPAFLSVDRVVGIIARYGTDGLMIQSDAGRGPGEPFALPNTLYRLAEEGLPESEIAKLAYHHPKWFYSQGIGARQAASRQPALARA